MAIRDIRVRRAALQIHPPDRRQCGMLSYYYPTPCTHISHICSLHPEPCTLQPRYVTGLGVVHCFCHESTFCHAQGRWPTCVILGSHSRANLDADIFRPSPLVLLLS